MNAPAPKVNFLQNLQLSDKQRHQLIFQFLRRLKNPPLSLEKQLHAAEVLLPLWKRDSSIKLQDLWEGYLNGFQAPSKPENQKTKTEQTEDEEADSGPLLSPSSKEPGSEATKAAKESFSLSIELNSRQLLACEFAKAGKSFVLTGAAGTGKTTAERQLVKDLLPFISKEHEFRDKRTGEKHSAPGIAVVSFTNKAANTSRRAIHKDPELEEKLPHNITTIHNLLEFMPVFFEKPDGKQGMKFEPQRNEYNPLDCQVIIIEEASTVGALDLYQHLYRAVRPGTTLIFVGDINQLPPIFSPSILNYALVQLPVVELVEIYRQAQDSPIISNAHRILGGKALEEKRPFFSVIGGSKLDKIVGPSYCVQKLVSALKKWIDMDDPSSPGEKMYDPSQDIILSPYNKGMAGTVEINNHIAQFLGARREASVFNILAGRTEHFLAVGDTVFSFKKEAIITKISHNGRYIGRTPKVPGTDLTRWGMRISNGKGKKGGNGKEEADGEGDTEFLLEGYENMNVDSIPDEGEDSRRQAASHIVDIEYVDGGEDTLESIGDFSLANFSLGYALTVHKAQGSEWRKVFFLIHQSQIAHLNRESFYTAVTRARTHLILIDFNDIRDRVISQQRIKGNSIEDKVQWFNSEISLKEPVRVLK